MCVSRLRREDWLPFSWWCCCQMLPLLATLGTAYQQLCQVGREGQTNQPPQSKHRPCELTNPGGLLPLSLCLVGWLHLLLLLQYQCRRSLETLRCLPPQHFYTGWVGDR